MAAIHSGIMGKEKTLMSVLSGGGRHQICVRNPSISVKHRMANQKHVNYAPTLPVSGERHGIFLWLYGEPQTSQLATDFHPDLAHTGLSVWARPVFFDECSLSV